MFKSHNRNTIEPLRFKNITVSIIYTNGKEWLDELCINIVNISHASALIPNIGETFIDHKRNEEYEVKDIIRSLNGNEYVIQVQLKTRERRKYQR